ncbi:unnamed protein product [Darwinula stevensoni]|uniref:Transporter n=1 Tax=Darwinula stevensoni TaxID=69355 RepID=A0A7R9A7V0_9CRUS|nr:unnamed protein product [Darwinula stevensoni]CAG0893592.1 unnamed protein product [Darwinula stevensoni]
MWKKKRDRELAYQNEGFEGSIPGGKKIIDGFAVKDDEKYDGTMDAEVARREGSKKGGMIGGMKCCMKGGGKVERGRWGQPVEFLFSCIAMSVGLGNVWRFPFVAYENGGGAFLIPYLVVLFLVGTPLFYMELCLGQFLGRGCVRVWDAVPFFRGIGFSQLVAVSLVVSYYCYLVGITFFYLAKSFLDPLPWSNCDFEGADELCFTAGDNASVNLSFMQSSSEQYYMSVRFRHHVLKLLPSDVGIDSGLGTVDYRLVACTGAAWLVILFMLVRGVRSSGKVAYFMALIPYIVLLTFLGKGATLDGAGDGVLYFLTPDWGALLRSKVVGGGRPDDLVHPQRVVHGFWTPSNRSLQVWFAAASQCFFSLSVAFGSTQMYASFNHFERNIYWDALVVCAVDTFTSLLSGLATFSVVGHLAQRLNVNVSEVIKTDTGLAFISYPDVISQFRVPQLYSVLFFVMMLTLGIGSAVSLVNTVITVLCDRFQSFNRLAVTVFCCLVGAASGFLYCTPGGMYVLRFVDYYGGSMVVFLAAFLEGVAISWVYGLGNFCDDVQFMIRIRPGWYWQFCWKVAVPLVLGAIFVYNLVELEPLKMGDYSYPSVLGGLGWLITIVAVGAIPGFALGAVLKADGASYMEPEAVVVVEAPGPADGLLVAKGQGGGEAAARGEKEA